MTKFDWYSLSWVSRVDRYAVISSSWLTICYFFASSRSSTAFLWFIFIILRSLSFVPWSFCSVTLFTFEPSICQCRASIWFYYSLFFIIPASFSILSSHFRMLSSSDLEFSLAFSFTTHALRGFALSIISALSFFTIPSFITPIAFTIFSHSFLDEFAQSSFHIYFLTSLYSVHFTL